MPELARGPARKMRTRLDQPVQYRLPLGDSEVSLNEMLGKSLSLRFDGVIRCVHCGRSTKRSYNQGYCYPCFANLAECDACIIAPEKCHYHEGSCRDPVWGEEFCMQDHIVYLANSSGLKVGITRASQIPTRWIDQGAVQALAVLRVRSRQQSGFCEHMFRQHIADRTNWRAMLSAEGERMDLAAERDRLLDECADELSALQQRFGLHALGVINGIDPVSIEYPGSDAPDKPKTLNLDKAGRAEGTLLGIKGQYLIFDTGVLNVRKYTGYELALSA